MNNSGQGSVVLQDSAAVPLQNLKIFGWSKQDGTPSPESPAPIVSAGDGGEIGLQITGKNLLDQTKLYPSQNNLRYGTTTDDVQFNLIAGINYTLSVPDDVTLPNGIYFREIVENSDVAHKYDSRSVSFKPDKNIAVRLDVYWSKGRPENATKLQLEVGSTATPYEPYKSQSLTLSTPNGLPGIPVDSGGNYTDASGQIFVSSFRDYASKTDVTQVKSFHVDTSPDSAWHSRNTGEYVDLYTYNTHVDYQVGYKNIICEFLPYNYNVFAGANEGCCLNGELTSDATPYFIFSFNRQTFNALKEDSQETVIQKFKDYIGPDGFSILYICNPIETPLSDEEITAFQNLTAYSPITTVTNDANCWMWIQYLQESEMSPWFYPKTEIGLYYKGYAGYETELPAPTCKETKLIKKLLDSSYQLDFEVTERSSRTEKYLWDLISKTNTMLANIPKTDTEKFLHMLLGGEVTEYPIIDCERNYWMSKSVEQ